MTQNTPYLSGEDGYLTLAREILEIGQLTEDRTGVGTLSLFGRQIRYDLTKAFPLFTTKKLFRKAIIIELLWFLRGDTNVKFLHDHGVTIWDEWMDENGDLGPVYGKQWRSWAAPDGRVIDQIEKLLTGLRNSPHGRRHIVSAWNPADVDDMALPPCHCLFQFYVRKEDDITYLDCQLYQRSADLFLGVPFNVASYALLTHMIAQQLDMVAGEFVHTFGDVHIYRNHISAVNLQLSRWSAMPAHPTLNLRKAESLYAYDLGDVSFEGYRPLASIPAPVAK